MTPLTKLKLTVEALDKIYADSTDTIWVTDTMTLFEWFCINIEGYEEYARKRHQEWFQ